MYNLLGIMEIICVVDILNFCWVDFFFKCSEVIFIELSSVLSGKCVFDGMLETSVVFTVDRFSSCFCETLSIEIFTCYLRYVTSISWDMLSLNIRVWSSNPVFSFHGLVSVLQFFGCFILTWWINEIIILVIVWLRNCNINIIL